MRTNNSFVLFFSALLGICMMATVIESSGEYSKIKKSINPNQGNDKDKKLVMVYNNGTKITEIKQPGMTKKEILERVNNEKRLEKIKKYQKTKIKTEKMKMEKIINNQQSNNKDKSKNKYWSMILSLFDKMSKKQLEAWEETGKKSEGIEKSRKIKKSESFSRFNEEHRKAVKELIHNLMGADDVDELVEIGTQYKPQVNHQLFIHAINSALRKKNFGVSPPNIEEALPMMFVSDSVSEAVKDFILGEDVNKIANNLDYDETLKIHRDVKPNTLKMTQSVKFDQESNRDEEERLGYWRNDPGLNSALYNWNIVHTPLETDDESKMERSGEQFYNYYNQLIARYNHERLSNGLLPVLPYGDMDKPIKEVFSPKFGAGARKIVGRSPNTTPADIEKPEDVYLSNLPLEKSFFPECRKKIVDQIGSRILTDKDGEFHELSDDVEKDLDMKRGIDILGRYINRIPTKKNDNEDKKTCAGLSNLGHLFLARVHDPKQMEPTLVGPMDSYITSACDPLFYRWHKYLDEIFQEYKKTQTPYTTIKLEYPDVRLAKVHIASDAGPVRSCGEVLTGCSIYKYDLTRGLDFEDDAVVELEHVRLDHFKFTTHIKLENQLKEKADVNIRIFLAPKNNEKGKTMTFNEQRLYWVLMDEWVQKLESGMNNIMRPSTKSTVSETCKNRFIDLESNSDGHCGCRWPQHLHLPKGTREGMAFQVFTFITKTHLEESKTSVKGDTCRLTNQTYPDNASLGFPFDRPIKKDISLKLWMKSSTNMFLSELKIRFTGKISHPNGLEFQDCPSFDIKKYNTRPKPEKYDELQERIALELKKNSEEHQGNRNNEGYEIEKLIMNIQNYKADNKINSKNEEDNKK